MDGIIEEVDKVILSFENSDFVKRMKTNKELIKNNNLINTLDVKKLYENDIVYEYVRNQNILDCHIYYLNKEIKKLISSKVCGSSNESN